MDADDDDLFERLTALGVFDPAADDADGRRALIEYLVELGATVDDLSEFRDELPVVASMLATRPPGPRITLREVAERAGVETEVAVRLWALLGLPVAGADEPVAYEATVELFQIFFVAQAVLGEAAGMQIARILGETMTRLTDALISSFIVTLGAPASDRDPTMLELAKENARISELLPPFVHALDVLLRHHLEVTRRYAPTIGYRGDLAIYETKHLAIGFADLTASTAYAARVDFGELADALETFEQLAADVVYRHGGRLVKLIGDEVMFSAADAMTASAIACDLVDAMASRSELPLRAGLAVGDVLVRSGDCFGPTVNLAARLVGHAEPGDVVAPAAIAEGLDPAAFAAEPLDPVALRGFDTPVPIVRVTRAVYGAAP
jgi:class 3 adenylate cyclase